MRWRGTAGKIQRVTYSCLGPFPPLKRKLYPKQESLVYSSWLLERVRLGDINVKEEEEGFFDSLW